MKTKILISFLVGLLIISVVSVGLVAAKSDNPGKGEKPAMAGRPEKLEQIIFVHPVGPGNGPPPGKGPPEDKGKPKPPPPPDPVNSYYELWGGYLDETATYYVNDNVGAEALAAVKAAAVAWDIETAAGLFSYGGTTEKSWYDEDGENTISWVKFFPRDYIAMVVMLVGEETNIIYEFDIVFNAFHKWGIDPIKEDGDKIKAFDIQNIATHEFGHPVGLDDLYPTEYRELTMYGYSSKGETQKCSLEVGDVTGAQFLYDE